MHQQSIQIVEKMLDVQVQKNRIAFNIKECIDIVNMVCIDIYSCGHPNHQDIALFELIQCTGYEQYLADFMSSSRSLHCE